VEERLVGSVALALLAAQRGARILRVHDVKETKQALQLWLAMEAHGQPFQQE
jgi:dihydropteroate synthase